MVIGASRRDGLGGHKASVMSRLDKFKEASIRHVCPHCAKSSRGGRTRTVLIVVVVAAIGYWKAVLRCNARTRCQEVAGNIRGSSRIACVLLAAKVVR
jgi:hypothetical protein